MRFTKMQGTGNDYVYLDGFRDGIPADPVTLAQTMSDRHFGIGGDGLILIVPSEKADARMRMFNADGTEAEMCGNGLRCVAKYVHDHGIAKKSQLKIETGRGILDVFLDVKNGVAQRATINMGEPILQAALIPTTLPGNPPMDVPLNVGDTTLHVTCISMGNPHCITFVDQITHHLVHDIGPKVEVHPAFPRKTNVEFIKINSRSDVNMRVWERGSGETLACGTGASAVAVAGVLTGRTDRKITIHLLGGELELEWSETDKFVYMTGPAVEVFSGEWPG